MKYSKINCILEGYDNYASVEIGISEKAKISYSTINKALLIAMNYLIENMEIDKQESAE